MMDTSEPAETPARRAVRRRSESVAGIVERAGPVPASERHVVSVRRSGGRWPRAAGRATAATAPSRPSRCPARPAPTSAQYVQGWFVPTTGGQCRVQVYVPKSTSPNDTGATAVHFAVMAGRIGETYADFALDEASNASRWVDGGSFPLHGGELAIRLTDRGVPQRSGDRIALSALRVTCAG